MNSRFIIDSLIKFNNSEIDKNKLNSEVFLGTAFNYFYFKKEFKKTSKLKESQNKVFQSYFKKESAQEASEKLLITQVRQKKMSIEKAQATIKEQRKELLNNLLQQKVISTYAEHSYNSYIPPKNFALSLDFHVADYKEMKKYLSNSNTNINYKNPILSNKTRDKIITPYSEPPYFLDVKNDLLLTTKKEAEIKKIKEEEKNEIKKLIDYDEDDVLFYSEKIERDDEAKKAAEWLKEIPPEEIDGNFNNLMEVRKNNKTLENHNSFYFDKNFFWCEFDPMSIFDDISTGNDRFKKFNQYLSEKSYKNYMKKMNYYYLDSMLIFFFDLEQEFLTYNFLDKEIIALNFIKKMLLSSGMCYNKLFDHINKAICSKKGNFTFENFVECFTPILEASKQFQTLKYKFLLYLVKNQNTQVITMENYRLFCNLIKGSMAYDEETYKKLSKNMIENFKKKYPKEYTDNFKYLHISTIVEFISDKEP